MVVRADRILAITKSDLIDEELMGLIKEEINVDVPYFFISAIANSGIQQLKDALWRTLTVQSDI